MKTLNGLIDHNENLTGYPLINLMLFDNFYLKSVSTHNATKHSINNEKVMYAQAVIN